MPIESKNCVSGTSVCHVTAARILRRTKKMHAKVCIYYSFIVWLVKINYICTYLIFFIFRSIYLNGMGVLGIWKKHTHAPKKKYCWESRKKDNECEYVCTNVYYTMPPPYPDWNLHQRQVHTFLHIYLRCWVRSKNSLRAANCPLRSTKREMSSNIFFSKFNDNFIEWNKRPQYV